MERQYKSRLPKDEELEKCVYIIRDEKNIPLATFKPVEILEYRNYIIPIYFDDPGQQFFVIFEDDEWGNPICHEDDFLDFIDSKLDALVPDRPINVLNKELSDLSYELLKLVREVEMGDTLYLKYKSLEKDIHKYLDLIFELLKTNTDFQDLDPLLQDQIKRVVDRELYNKAE